MTDNNVILSVGPTLASTLTTPSSVATSNVIKERINQDPEREAIDRKFPIFGPIDGETVQIFIQNMIAWIDDSISAPIELWINSPGGGAVYALAIYDLIKYAPFPVYTIGIGEVCSAALLLLAAGTKDCRAVFPNCRLMLHSLSYGAEGTFQEMNIIFKEVKTLQKRWARLTAENSNMTEKQINAMFKENKDHWIYPDEAIELGIIDDVISGEEDFGK